MVHGGRLTLFIVSTLLLALTALGGGIEQYQWVVPQSQLKNLEAILGDFRKLVDSSDPSVYPSVYPFKKPEDGWSQDQLMLFEDIENWKTQGKTPMWLANAIETLEFLEQHMQEWKKSPGPIVLQKANGETRLTDLFTLHEKGANVVERQHNPEHWTYHI